MIEVAYPNQKLGKKRQVLDLIKSLPLFVFYPFFAELMGYCYQLAALFFRNVSGIDTARKACCRYYLSSLCYGSEDKYCFYISEKAIRGK